MKMLSAMGPLMLASALTASDPSSAAAGPEDTRPEAGAIGSSDAVDPRADRILREMGEYLASAQEYSFEADVLYDTVGSNDEKTLLGGHAEVSVTRPDRLHVRYDGDERRSRIVLDGRTFTFLDVVSNLYARMEVPRGIDAAVDTVFETVGQSVPIADLAYADPYATLIESAETGLVVGRHPVDGAPCHHLAFSNEAIDWQIWIEDGPRPVPRRLVISYRNEPGSPQYIARLSGWDFHPRLAKTHFVFRPPAGSEEIAFLPVESEGVTP